MMDCMMDLEDRLARALRDGDREDNNKRRRAMMKIVTQVLVTSRSRDGAASSLEALALQDNYLGGRVIGDGRVKPYAAQAFFPAPDGVRAGTQLSPEQRVVLIPDKLYAGCEVVPADGS